MKRGRRFGEEGEDETMGEKGEESKKWIFFLKEGKRKKEKRENEIRNRVVCGYVFCFVQCISWKQYNKNSLHV